ncbi:MAG TPA: HAD hydrolase family protein [Gemmatimonas sp.]|uniref:HAD hydrolase family protein n=1 Tax=Gemmatimonas sp. TaxID=1962908 RepID=UPI002ED7C2CA
MPPPHELSSRAPLLIVSDVDGTLIDERGQLPCTTSELRAHLAALAAARGAPVTLALASSRTMRELTVLQRALGLYGPCIAEDGALLAVDVKRTGVELGGERIGDDVVTNPTEWTALTNAGRRTLSMQSFAADAAALTRMMNDCRAFHDADVRHLGVQEWISLGFRTPASVRRALAARHHSILLDPEVLDANALSTLRESAAHHALQLRRGGRWLTLTAASGKGAALRALRHNVSLDGVSPLIVAVGNEENDISLLAEADLRFVIRNPHRGPLESLASLPGAVVLTPEGPGGWIDMLNRLHLVAS